MYGGREHREEAYLKTMLGIAVFLAALWIVSGVLPRRFSQTALSYFGQEFLDRASDRAALSYAATGFETIVTFVALFKYASKEFKAKGFLSKSAFKDLTPAGAFGVGAWLAVQVGLLLSVVSLPFVFYRGYYLEKAFQLSRMTPLSWFSNFAKNSLFNLALYAGAGGLAAFLIMRFPRTWQYFLTVTFFAGSLFFSYVYPSVIAPMFDRFTPLQDGAVLSEITELADKAGMHIETVLVMEASSKTARSNAYFTGIGNSRRVVLYDNLLENQSIEEVRLVLAHEMGHWKYGHIVSSIAMSAVGTIAITLLFSLISGPLPERFQTLTLRRILLSLILFSVFASYLATPAASWLSRKHEVQADMFSLELTGDSGSFIAAMANLAKTNLGDVEPPKFIKWFAWTHPSTVERIIMGEAGAD